MRHEFETVDAAARFVADRVRASGVPVSNASRMSLSRMRQGPVTVKAVIAMGAQVGLTIRIVVVEA